MIFDYANLTQLITAKCGSMSAFAKQAGIDTAALDEYLDGVTPWPQDAKDRAVKVLGIPDEYIPRYFFIYQLNPGKPKYHIDPAAYIRIRDVYNNAADMRWAKQIRLTSTLSLPMYFAPDTSAPNLPPQKLIDKQPIPRYDKGIPPRTLLFFLGGQNIALSRHQRCAV